MLQNELIKRTIKFNPIDHTYTDLEVGDKYTPVTTLVEEYCEQFDTDLQANLYAKRHGGTPDYWKNKWAGITQVACDRGNVTHKELETNIDNFYVNSKPIEGTSYTLGDIKNTVRHMILNKKELEASPLKYMYPDIYNRLVDLINQGFTLFVEKRVYWVYYLIAGTIDLIAIKKNQFYIIDWKTNKDELKFTAGYYKKNNGVKTNIWIPQSKKLYKPLNHLALCKGIKYTLQLSIYAYLTELWGYECLGIELYHIRGRVVQVYNIDYLRNDIKRLLEHKKMKKEQKKNNDELIYGF